MAGDPIPKGSSAKKAKAVKPTRPALPVGCEAGIQGVCTFRAEHLHHIVLRSRGGSDHASNLLALCNACHNHIHRNPGWATDQGFMAHGWAS